MKIKNPKVTITFVNEEAEDYTFEGLFINDDNKVVYVQFTIEAGQTRDIECIFEQGIENGYKTWGGVTLPDCSASDLVNCTFDDGYLLITDPTKDASATITYILEG